MDSSSNDPYRAPAASTRPAAPSRDAEVLEAVSKALDRVAPLWPLDRFVAVNPFVGLTDLDFAGAARAVGLASGARLTMPREFYADAIAAGRIARQDLEAALRASSDRRGLPATVDELMVRARQPAAGASIEPLPTVAHVATIMTDRDWTASTVDRISAWAAAYFDRGQSLWRSPWRELSPYAAWREEAQIDRTPAVWGLSSFQEMVAALPADPKAMVVEGLQRLRIPAASYERYAHRLLMSIAGWAGYARFLRWERELRGETDGALFELLAIRLAWEVLLHDGLRPAGVASGWADARRRLLVPTDPGSEAGALGVDLVLQTAYEHAWQRQLFAKMPGRRQPSAPPERPRLQAAFCIDVRSEVYRRALESCDPKIQTIGFAGFFGIPIEYVPAGAQQGAAQCPVLLTPKFVVREQSTGAGEALGARRARGLSVIEAIKAFKLDAVSTFSFVDTLGLSYLSKLVTDAFGRTRPVPHPREAGLPGGAAEQLGPSIEADTVGDRQVGMTSAQRVDTAEAVLKAMSLTKNHARVILLVGHGSTTVNNPHATGLDCGACGGHSGEANARVAAQILNDPDVRQGLSERGIDLPEDTLFVAGLHDTTTDEVRIFDVDEAPESHAYDLAYARDWLQRASTKARADRAPSLHLPRGARVDEAIVARSRDWAQVRPEWGLAGCAAFVAAPRARTEGLDLGGRVFLHSYEWQRDEGFGVLELIMTAPVVVASWISLQYYGSAVDNEAFGCGNKVLHNVVGALGVLEGNGGDLRVGLPLQSVHDGERWVHEPMRLSVLIEAPAHAMNEVIQAHEGVRALVDHGWLHLFRIDETGEVAERYAGDLRWVPVQPVAAEADAPAAFAS